MWGGWWGRVHFHFFAAFTAARARAGGFWAAVGRRVVARLGGVGGGGGGRGFIVFTPVLVSAAVLVSISILVTVFRGIAILAAVVS